LKAGQFSLHADMLAHGSEPNASDRRRCGLTVRYCPPCVVPLEPGYGARAILCRGSVDESEWSCRPCPQGEDIPEWVVSIGGN